MLAFLESLYLIEVEQEGAHSPGALIAEIGADDDYSEEMEFQAYRSALDLLVVGADRAQEPLHVKPAWNRVDSISDSDSGSGSYAIPG